MIRQVFQSGLHTPIIFAGDEYEAIGFANLAGQALELLGRFSRRIFFVHSVEHRKVDRLGIDQLDIVAAAAKPLNHEFGKPDAHPVGAIGAVENEDSIAHGSPSAAPLLTSAAALATDGVRIFDVSIALPSDAPRLEPNISRYERGVANAIGGEMSCIVWFAKQMGG